MMERHYSHINFVDPKNRMRKDLNLGDHLKPRVGLLKLVKIENFNAII